MDIEVGSRFFPTITNNSWTYLLVHNVASLHLNWGLPLMTKERWMRIYYRWWTYLLQSCSLDGLNCYNHAHHALIRTNCPLFNEHPNYYIIHIIAYISTLFLFIAEQYSIVWICHISFIHSLVDRHLDCFRFWAFMNNAAMNISVKILV